MKKYQLFSEFSSATVYGETLADAIMHTTIKTPRKYDRDLQTNIEGIEVEIEKVIGYDDTSKATRGNHKYESVIIETKDGKRMAIDAQYISEIITA